MISSQKFAIIFGLNIFLLTGCSGGSDLWPSLDATDATSNQNQSAQTGISNSGINNAENNNISGVDIPTTSTSPQGVTFIGNKVAEMARDLSKLQANLNTIEEETAKTSNIAENSSNDYHSLVGIITAHLQRGTTSGNPVLVGQWNMAQAKLEQVAEVGTAMVKLSNDATNKAAFGQYLLNAVQATYGLSGAVDSDHVQLQKLEDNTHQTLVRIDRIMTDLSHDMNRQNVYINNERQNMTILSLAIKNGELYGSSLATRAFTQTENIARAESISNLPKAGEKPLVIIRFDRANVEYQQILYNAVSQALSRKSSATFNLVAVNPQQGTAAQMALNGAAARRNAQDVLRTMTDMGVSSSRIQMLTANDPAIKVNEVRLFVH